jgi:hemerythrin superfamily protein
MTSHQDAVTLLTEDHRTVEQLFADYERGLQGPEAKRQVVDQIIRELSVHAAIEEVYFYPAVRKALSEGGELVDEGLHEHQEVKETLAALEDMDPADAAYDRKVASLIADVRHHVQEEEGEMFPKLRAALGAEQLVDIGRKLADGKAKAPTRPHPAAPASGPGVKLAGPAAGMVDRVRDKLGDRPADPSA